MSAANGETLVIVINRLLLRLDARGVSANQIVACIKPLIAESEAKAVASALSNVTCTHHNDKQRAECPVCLVAALRADVERLGHLEAVLRSSAADMTAGSITAGGVADLRAENERLRRAYVRPDDIRAQLESATARAERAEGNLAALEQSFDDNCRGVVKIADELAVERARLDWLESPAGMHWQWQAGITRATIDAKMQKDAK